MKQKYLRSTPQIQLVKLFHVGSHDLIRINEDDFLYVKGKQYVEEQNFIAPNRSLLLRLLM